MRVLLVLITLFITVIQSVRAQEENPALDLVNWGNSHFPYPEWKIDLTVDGLSAGATWSHAGEVIASPMVFHHIDFNQAVYSAEEISTFVDKEYLAVIMESYDSWQELGRCTAKNQEILLIEIDGFFEGKEYNVHYWLWSEGDQFRTVFMAYPGIESRNMTPIIATMFADATTCEGLSSRLSGE